ncbi:SDR family NAD(P)-dependent oxidoreductase [Nocardioides sp.]|uniref:SDR family NAD(P)-dependent oxidoreductase n=1 Tax=Nocardioides sp. TaxID=35761 RepID=UPI001A2A13B1|nr:SDR family NAD(P)-dependent oxidoreductase [Nocardioides sp.]MBJ7355813.1 SDR family NAD(P)-dependent oxidoreductase [Nocardioides sp.]
MTRLLDRALDRSVVLGYSKVGSALRRRWWPADPEPGALAGKRVLVTGATSGIGEAMARSFADLGASVHVLGRNGDKLAEVARQLRLDKPATEVVEEVCDVGDLDAVRGWAADFTGRVPALHGLVHNAGTMTEKREESPQGHELGLAVHVLGPHVMSELLHNPLAAAGGASVVWMSSGGMYSARLPADVDGYESRGVDKGGYNGVRAYARTKRMQVVIADAWARRLAAQDVRVESMHPGWVGTPGVATHLPTFNMITKPVLRDSEDGADTAVWLVATRPSSEPPHFWHDRAQRPVTMGRRGGPDPVDVRRFLLWVSETTSTPATW